MASLTGLEIHQLQQALRPAFTRQELERLLLFRLDRRLEDIAAPGDALPDAILRVVRAAEAKGWTAGLLEAVAAERPRNTEIQQVVAHLRLRLAAPENPIPCPYPGMKPFEPEDARFFYGREQEIKEILRRLRCQRLLFVIGPSGSGKSSLINAGLLPLLAASRMFPRGYWLVRSLRPGAHPMQALRSVLGGDPAQPGEAVAGLLAANPPAQRLLLVIDQFEELFSQAGRKERKRFIATFQRLSGVEACTLLAAMRADFYPDLMNSDLWPAYQRGQHIEVAPLRGEALKEAIISPASQSGVQVEDALAEMLLADAEGEPGVLPMLQETLRLLWADMTDHSLTLDAYRGLGKEGRSGLAVAIATKADAVFDGLSARERATARRIFLRLIQFGEGRADTRRQQPETELRSVSDNPDTFADVLNLLVANRLLTLSAGADDNERQVDISHEALIAGWPRLQAWADERRGAEQARRRLEIKAEEWVRLGRGDGGLLDETELLEAERWLGSADAGELGYSHDLQELVEASRAALDREAEEREATRQRELEAARALAEEQRKRAAEQMLSVRRLARWALLAAAAGVAALLLGLATAWFGVQNARNALEAQENARRAKAGELAAAAQLEMVRDAPDPSLYLLLAQEAISMTLTTDGYVTENASQAILDAIEAAPPWATNLPYSAHEGLILSASYDEGTGRLTTTSDDGTVRVWDMATGDVLLTLGDRADPIFSASYGPDKRRIATSGSGGKLRVWDALSGEQILEIATRGERPGSIVYSPDGTRILMCGCDRWDEGICTRGILQVWDAASGQQALAIPIPENGIPRAAYSPDSKRIITAGLSGRVRIWNAMSGEQIMAIAAYRDTATSAGYSPDGQHIITAGCDHRDDAMNCIGGMVRIWDASGGGLEAAIPAHGALITSAAYHPDGQQILTSGIDSMEGDSLTSIRAWDVASGQQEWEVSGADIIPPVYSSGGELVVVTDLDGVVRTWDASNGEPLSSLVVGKGQSGAIDTIEYSPDGRRILTTSWDGWVRVWDTVGRNQVLAILPHRSMITSAQFSPDGDHILTSGCDQRDETGSCIRAMVRVWDALNGRRVIELPAHEGWIDTAGYHPDGSRILTSGCDQRDETGSCLRATVRAWDTLNGTRLLELPAYVGWISSTEYSPDGRQILAAGCERLDETGSCARATVRVWDGSNGEQLLELPAHEGRIDLAKYSPDSRHILTSGCDQRDEAGNCVNAVVRIWDAQNGEQALELAAYEGWIDLAEYSPDGNHILTFECDNRDDAGSCTRATVRVWDALNGELVLDLPAHEGGTAWAEYGPDGRHIITSGCNGWIPGGPCTDVTVRFWDALSGEQIIEIPAYDRGLELNLEAHSPDGRYIVTAAGGMMRVWDLERAPAALHLGANRVNLAAYSPDGRSIATTAECDWWDDVTSCTGDTVLIWDAESGKPVREISTQQRRITSLAYSPDSKRIVASGCDRLNDEWICTDSSIRVWDASNGQELLKIPTHVGEVDSAIFSPDGTHILAVGDDDTTVDFERAVRVWDGASGQQTFSILSPAGGVEQAVYSPDNKHILTAERDGAMRMWDALNGQPMTEIAANMKLARSIAYSPDGSRIVAADCVDSGLTGYCKHNKVRVWDSASKQPVLEFSANNGGAEQVIFSPDGSRIITSGCDGVKSSLSCMHSKVQVWDAANAKPLLTIPIQGGRLTLTAFSPDGSRIVTVGDDGALRMWPGEPETALNMAGSRVQRYNPWLTPEERQRYGLD